MHYRFTNTESSSTLYLWNNICHTWECHELIFRHFSEVFWILEKPVVYFQGILIAPLFSHIWGPLLNPLKSLLHYLFKVCNVFNRISTNRLLGIPQLTCLKYRFRFLYIFLLVCFRDKTLKFSFASFDLMLFDSHIIRLLWVDIVKSCLLLLMEKYRLHLFFLLSFEIEFGWHWFVPLCLTINVLANGS